jgi:hypothetical protein
MKKRIFVVKKIKNFLNFSLIKANIIIKKLIIYLH